VSVRNLETLRKQNIDDASRVRWVLRNITDHEAIDSAIHLAGNVRWFHCGSDLDPPFDLIVSAFEGCFDSTGELYPGMTDRAYFSGRAILKISVGARLQSHERASKYTIPNVPDSSIPSTRSSTPVPAQFVCGPKCDQPSFGPRSDLECIISMMQFRTSPETPINIFRRDISAHSLWMPNLVLEMFRMDPTSPGGIFCAFPSRIEAANLNILVWYTILGGRVEEETFWVVEKSYAANSSFSLSTHSDLRLSVIR